VLVALAFQVQHRVHHVLEHARPRDRAVFRDVTDQKDRRVRALGVVQHREPALANLRHRAGPALEIGARHRLDRIHHHRVGRERGSRLEHGLEVGLAQQQKRRRHLAQARGAQTDLLLALLAGHVQDAPALARERHRELQQQRALADPGVAAHEQQ
jgi:hypothetical protein